MSILYRSEPYLPLPDLVLVWIGPPLASVPDRQFILAFMRDAKAGRFDQVTDGHPGILLDDRTGRAPPLPLSGEEIERDLAYLLRTRQALDIDEACLQLAQTLLITREAALEFAQRREIKPPWFWAPKPSAPVDPEPAPVAPPREGAGGRPELDTDQKRPMQVARYAGIHGPDAAVKHFNIKPATVDRYLRQKEASG